MNFNSFQVIEDGLDCHVDFDGVVFYQEDDCEKNRVHCGNRAFLYEIVMTHWFNDSPTVELWVGSRITEKVIKVERLYNNILTEENLKQVIKLINEYEGDGSEV